MTTATIYDPLDTRVPIHIDMEAQLFGQLTRRLSDTEFAVDLTTRAHRADLEEIWRRVLPVPSSAEVLSRDLVVDRAALEAMQDLEEVTPGVYDSAPHWADKEVTGWDMPVQPPSDETKRDLDTLNAWYDATHPQPTTGPMPAVITRIGPRVDETVFVPPSRFNFVRNWFAKRRWQKQYSDAGLDILA